MLKAAGDLGLLAESTQALGVSHSAGFDELERHITVQLDVLGQEDFAQGPGGVEP
jgi:hypothetical protein